MSETEFTPGPWTCPGATFAENDNGFTGTAYFVESNGKPVPVLFENACLIAAAPELYKALSLIVDQLRFENETLGQRSDWNLVDALMALAKARGQEV
jgi:hypothetical protein